MKFSGKVVNMPVNKWLNLGGDPDHRMDTGIVFQIHHHWEIWKVVNRHKSAAHTDLPVWQHLNLLLILIRQYGSTSKTCLDRGMHCPSASSLKYF